MKKALNRISVKYSVAFTAAAISLLIVFALNFFLVSSMKKHMVEIGNDFTRAIFLITNADRDLYQAQMSVLEYMREEPGTENAEKSISDFQENTQQVQDRLNEFSSVMVNHPEITQLLNGSEEKFTQWLAQAKNVITLHAQDNDRAADSLLDGQATASFADFRDFLNSAGESIMPQILEMEESAISKINTHQISTFTFVLLVFIAAVSLALIGPQMMSKAIRQITGRIKEIAEGDGDLTARINTKRSDEIGDLALQFNAFVSRIDKTLQAVSTSTKSVHFASDEIAKGSQDLASRTEQAASSLQETSASMEEITATVAVTSDAATEANQLVLSTVDVTRRGQEAMDQVKKTMEEIRTSASQISEIITLIDGIAFQTNILALNASVEAARAGEHGRGFAVVAQEVRTLASRSSDASRDIRELIDTSVTRTQTGVDLVQSTGKTMNEIVDSIERVTHVIGDITAGAKEQSLGIMQINTAINQLDNMTQQNASLVEESSAAAGEMREQAERLNSLIASFKLSNDQADSLPTPSVPVVSQRHSAPHPVRRPNLPQARTSEVEWEAF
ncbi:MAG: chemotaxis protein [Halomonadaceae bacterium]|nr:chemotaxis protein [Halomonadaceae bacterium]